jgi:hypothetical protein
LLPFAMVLPGCFFGVAFWFLEVRRCLLLLLLVMSVAEGETKLLS